MLGIVMIPHGAQKLLGIFGGAGFGASMGYFTSTGIPAPVAFLVIMAESLGALALVLGFFGRFMAFGIGLDMLGAILIVHLPHGFFMNWYGAQAGEGFEYHLLAIALSLVIIIGGSGKLSGPLASRIDAEVMFASAVPGGGDRFRECARTREGRHADRFDCIARRVSAINAGIAE